MEVLTNTTPMGKRLVNSIALELKRDWEDFLTAGDNSPRFAGIGHHLAKVVKNMTDAGELLFYTLGGRMVNADTMELFSRMNDLNYRSNTNFPTLGRQAINDPDTAFLRVVVTRAGEKGYHGPGKSTLTFDDLNDYYTEVLSADIKPEGKEEICCSHVVIFAKFVLALRDSEYRVTRVKSHIEEGQSFVETDLWDGRTLVTITLFCGRVTSHYWALCKRYDDAAAGRNQV